MNFFKENKHTVFFFCYHLLFIFFAYQIRITRGVSDSHLYWAQTFDITKNSWFDFLNYGTDFILFLNYPLVKIGLPFWSGFLIYGTIGFLGILKWIEWTELVFKDAFVYKGFNVVYLICFLPNLHFWTATLGKEPIIFWALASVFYSITLGNYKSFGFIIGSLLLIAIRPHVALMLFFAIALVLTMRKHDSLKKRMIIVSVAVLILSLCAYMVLQLSNIKHLDWNRIKYFNDYSILSFRHSGSYVPMLEYTWGYRLFVLNFQPLFFDAKSILDFLASSENILLLGMHFFALYFTVRFYKKIEFTQWMKIAFLFSLVAGLLYIQRYANLGIFMRTKMMFQPFVLTALLYILKQGMAFQKSKS